jgi:Flp pilus assembly protein TadG
MAFVSRATLRRRAAAPRPADCVSTDVVAADGVAADGVLADGLRPDGVTPRREKGQSLAEFALVLLPLCLILLGIMQMGLIFNGYVTLANASREAAREASIYVYDRTKTKSQNDSARAAIARTSFKASMGLLPSGSPWLTDANILVTYSLPTGVAESDPRRGQYVTVNATYKMDMIIPMIAGILPKDGNGRLPLGTQTSMTIN